MTLVRPLTYGRMGNFLFQAAAAMGYAGRHGIGFTLPSVSTNEKWNPVYLQHLVNKEWDGSLPEIRLEERKFTYNELPFNKEWVGTHNIVLDGYWQTEKYFKEFRREILSAFDFPWQLKPHTVSIHVRRTDYLRLPHKHPAVSKGWMEAQMLRFPGFVFVFFSDDIAWCQAEFGDRNDCYFSTGKTEVEDLISMSECEHHICSASTYSWWGAWLNRNPTKRVIMPKLWFMPGHGGLDTSDIVPKEWERL